MVRRYSGIDKADLERRLEDIRPLIDAFNQKFPVSEPDALTGADLKHYIDGLTPTENQLWVQMPTLMRDIEMHNAQSPEGNQISVSELNRLEAVNEKLSKLVEANQFAQGVKFLDKLHTEWEKFNELMEVDYHGLEPDAFREHMVEVQRCKTAFVDYQMQFAHLQQGVLVDESYKNGLDGKCQELFNMPGIGLNQLAASVERIPNQIRAFRDARVALENFRQAKTAYDDLMKDLPDLSAANSREMLTHRAEIEAAYRKLNATYSQVLEHRDRLNVSDFTQIEGELSVLNNEIPEYLGGVHDVGYLEAVFSHREDLFVQMDADIQIKEKDERLIMASSALMADFQALSGVDSIAFEDAQKRRVDLLDMQARYDNLIEISEDQNIGEAARLHFKEVFGDDFADKLEEEYQKPLKVRLDASQDVDEQMNNFEDMRAQLVQELIDELDLDDRTFFCSFQMPGLKNLKYDNLGSVLSSAFMNRMSETPITFLSQEHDKKDFIKLPEKKGNFNETISFRGALDRILQNDQISEQKKEKARVILEKIDQLENIYAPLELARRERMLRVSSTDKVTTRIRKERALELSQIDKTKARISTLERKGDSITEPENEKLTAYKKQLAALQRKPYQKRSDEAKRVKVEIEKVDKKIAEANPLSKKYWVRKKHILERRLQGLDNTAKTAKLKAIEEQKKTASNKKKSKLDKKAKRVEKRYEKKSNLEDGRKAVIATEEKEEKINALMQQYHDNVQTDIELPLVLLARATENEVRENSVQYKSTMAPKDTRPARVQIRDDASLSFEKRARAGLDQVRQTRLELENALLNAQVLDIPDRKAIEEERAFFRGLSTDVADVYQQVRGIEDIFQNAIEGNVDPDDAEMLEIYLEDLNTAYNRLDDVYLEAIVKLNANTTLTEAEKGEVEAALMYLLEDVQNARLLAEEHYPKLAKNQNDRDALNNINEFLQDASARLQEKAVLDDHLVKLQPNITAEPRYVKAVREKIALTAREHEEAQRGMMALFEQNPLEGTYQQFANEYNQISPDVETANGQIISMQDDLAQRADDALNRIGRPKKQVRFQDGDYTAEEEKALRSEFGERKASPSEQRGPNRGVDDVLPTEVHTVPTGQHGRYLISINPHNKTELDYAKRFTKAFDAMRKADDRSAYSKALFSFDARKYSEMSQSEQKEKIAALKDNISNLYENLSTVEDILEEIHDDPDYGPRSALYLQMNELKVWTLQSHIPLDFTLDHLRQTCDRSASTEQQQQDALAKKLAENPSNISERDIAEAQKARAEHIFHQAARDVLSHAVELSSRIAPEMHFNYQEKYKVDHTSAENLLKAIEKSDLQQLDEIKLDNPEGYDLETLREGVNDFVTKKSKTTDESEQDLWQKRIDRLGQAIDMSLEKLPIHDRIMQAKSVEELELLTFEHPDDYDTKALMQARSECVQHLAQVDDDTKELLQSKLDKLDEAIDHCILRAPYDEAVAEFKVAQTGDAERGAVTEQNRQWQQISELRANISSESSQLDALGHLEVLKRAVDAYQEKYDAIRESQANMIRTGFYDEQNPARREEDMQALRGLYERVEAIHDEYQDLLQAHPQDAVKKLIEHKQETMFPKQEQRHNRGAVAAVEFFENLADKNHVIQSELNLQPDATNATIDTMTAEENSKVYLQAVREMDMDATLDSSKQYDWVVLLTEFDPSTSNDYERVMMERVFHDMQNWCKAQTPPRAFLSLGDVKDEILLKENLEAPAKELASLAADYQDQLDAEKDNDNPHPLQVQLLTQALSLVRAAHKKVLPGPEEQSTVEVDQSPDPTKKSKSVVKQATATMLERMRLDKVSIQKLRDKKDAHKLAKKSRANQKSAQSNLKDTLKALQAAVKSYNKIAADVQSYKTLRGTEHIRAMAELDHHFEAMMKLKDQYDRTQGQCHRLDVDTTKIDRQYRESFPDKPVAVDAKQMSVGYFTERYQESYLRNCRDRKHEPRVTFDRIPNTVKSDHSSVYDTVEIRGKLEALKEATDNYNRVVKDFLHGGISDSQWEKIDDGFEMMMRLKGEYDDLHQQLDKDGVNLSGVDEAYQKVFMPKDVVMNNEVESVDYFTERYIESYQRLCQDRDGDPKVRLDDLPMSVQEDYQAHQLPDEGPSFD